MIDDDSLPTEFPRAPNRVTLFLGTQSGFTQVELSPNILALTPSELISELSDLVMSINLAAGIANSYDSKLNEAVRALDDANQNNDVAAVNAMYAFCNSVEAQRGNKISDSDASELIDAANQVIASIDEFAAPCL